MRIALLASGRSYHATRWANSLSERGIKIGFFTIHPVVRPLTQSVELFTLGDGKKLDYVFSANRVRTALESWGADLVHCHYATGYGLLGKLSSCDRRILSLYGADVFDFPHKSFIHKRMLRYITQGACAILSTSEVMAVEFQKTYPDLKKPTVTPFGVDVYKFLPVNSAATKRNGYDIGIVKKLERKYGVDVLIEAFAILIHSHSEYEWNLNIVGEGSQRLALEEQISVLGLQSSVNLMGPIQNNQVPVFLKQQDVFVVPSRDESESFGVAAVEAQACGLPVVASDVGGLPEVVSDGITGLIVPKEDPVALSHAIEKICLNDELRRNMSTSARERVIEKYNWSKNLDQMIEIYKSNCKSLK